MITVTAVEGLNVLGVGEKVRKNARLAQDMDTKNAGGATERAKKNVHRVMVAVETYGVNHTVINVTEVELLNVINVTEGELLNVINAMEMDMKIVQSVLEEVITVA